LVGSVHTVICGDKISEPNLSFASYSLYRSVCALLHGVQQNPNTSLPIFLYPDKAFGAPELETFFFFRTMSWKHFDFSGINPHWLLASVVFINHQGDNTAIIHCIDAPRV
jgi:hypothetical protein